MHHSSHYLERILYSSFIALFALSAFLLLMDIDSFSGMISSDSVFVADSCEKTVPSSIPCNGNLDCDDGFSRQMVLSQNGEGMCCCIQIKVR